LQAILSDETAVEQAKKQGAFRNHLSRRALLAEVFGKGEYKHRKNQLLRVFLLLFAIEFQA
jgi:hypothetical protein